MEVGAEQEAIGDLMGPVAGVCPDVGRFEGGKMVKAAAKTPGTG